ncbi:MAG: TetR/AcrR family transcriptional regulator [Pseudanabaenaceae cyanobacterium]
MPKGHWFRETRTAHSYNFTYNKNMPKVVEHGAYRWQIAENLGISTGRLYHYFPSKEALFEQLWDFVTGEHIQRAMPALLATDCGSICLYQSL